MARLKKYSIVIAVDEKNGIGKNGTLAWSIKDDMKHFKEITSTTKNKKKQNAVIMGRKTRESIPEKFRPLPGRLNCVLSSNYKNTSNEISENAYGFHSFDDCHKFVSERKDIENVFIIGGSYLYNLVLDSDYLNIIYLTRVYGEFNCDVFFSDIPHYFKVIKTSEKKTEGDISYQMFSYKNGGNFLPKLIRPAMIAGVLIFTVTLGYLVYTSFLSNHVNNKSSQENTVEQEIAPLKAMSEEELIETPAPEEEEIETVSNIPEIKTFTKSEETLGSITIYSPETDISELQEIIEELINRKKIIYKILLHNEKLAGEQQSKIVLDYEVASDTSDAITIVYTDTKNEEIMGKEEIVYTRN